VETLEELAIGLKETFVENGGESFSVVPCLNDSAHSMEMLSTISWRELGGWI
jgi:ferrochelatase